MNLNDMEVYIYSIYNIINKLRGQIKFDFSLNDDKNICLEIVDSKIADIRPRDFIIEFDKNLGNFTIITNIELEDIKRREIVSLISNAINISQVASYTNHNLNLNFDYFIYDKTKTKFNMNYLNRQGIETSSLKFYENDKKRMLKKWILMLIRLCYNMLYK